MLLLMALADGTFRCSILIHRLADVLLVDASFALSRFLNLAEIDLPGRLAYVGYCTVAYVR
jgi:hypothetical protein